MAAVDTEERLLGYLLYRLTGLKAVLTHLCVEPHARKCGVATALFGELVERTKHLQGISATTRREFQANKVWPKFGFAAVGEKLGRGRDPKILTIWWFQHQHPTLFSFAANNQQGKQPMDVVIDLNVFYDFYFERANSRESQALVAD